MSRKGENTADASQKIRNGRGMQKDVIKSAENKELEVWREDCCKRRLHMSYCIGCALKDVGGGVDSSGSDE